MGVHDGHRARLKAEFLSNPNAFSELKLLELLLFYAQPRADTNPLAHALLNRFGSIPNILDARPGELKQIEGVGDNITVFFKLVKALSGRYLMKFDRTVNVIKTRADIYDALAPRFYGAEREMVLLLCLNSSGQCLGIQRISEGTVRSAEVTKRQVLTEALALNATAVVLAHNHPSGSRSPSGDDLAVTKDLVEALRGVDIELIDHMIFADEHMTSILTGVQVC